MINLREIVPRPPPDAATLAGYGYMLLGAAELWQGTSSYEYALRCHLAAATYFSAAALMLAAPVETPPGHPLQGDK